MRLANPRGCAGTELGEIWGRMSVPAPQQPFCRLLLASTSLGDVTNEIGITALSLYPCQRARGYAFYA